MRRDIFTSLVTIAGVIPSAPSLPLPRWPTLSHRDGPDTCQFFGFSMDNKTYNSYKINIASGDDNGWLSKCDSAVNVTIESECKTVTGNFTCEPSPQSSHSARITFDIVKSEVTQPGCVSDALKETSLVIGDETIECFCLAHCGTADDAIPDPSRRKRSLLDVVSGTRSWGRLYMRSQH